ncbi:hybrid sensor histidine kinase/response regulator [Paenibacillus humicus]|uniref:hybrid sensor histidine kinase/response regulator n=1 Tax=Paenibacillus humicus TaxID=412861 RepID=UPI003F147E51
MTIPQKFFANIEEASTYIIDVLSRLLMLDSMFIATNDGKVNEIIKAFNRSEILVGEGTRLPFEESYCSLVVKNSTGLLYIPHTTNDGLARHMEVTAVMGNRSFIGVPIVLASGRSYGTVCGLHKPGHVFSEADIKAISAMAVFLSYIVEMENKVRDQSKLQKSLLREKQYAESLSRWLKQENDLTRGKLNWSSDLLAMLSHEIRNSVSGIAGMTELIQNTALSEEQVGYLKLIEAGNRTLTTLLDNILDYSKLEAGKMSLEEQPFDLVSLIEETVYLYASKASSRGLELIIDLPPDLPVFYGDSGKIKQMLANLLSNAIKFTDRGEIAVSVQTAPGTTGDSLFVAISVKDSGIGIEESRIKEMFGKYAQVHESRPDRDYKGTGLGLAISKNLAELLGGSIEARSVLGQGTEVGFTIDLTKQSMPSSSYGSAMLRGKSLLIVDDHAGTLESLSRLAERWDMSVKAVRTAEEALACFEIGQKFDLALIDDMPGSMAAAELAERLRGQQPELPLVLLAPLGKPLPDEVRQLFSSAVAKPVRQLHLLNAIASLQAARS